MAIENTKDIVLDEIIWSADLYIKKKMPAVSSVPLTDVISACSLLDMPGETIDRVIYDDLERAAIAKTKADNEEERAKGYEALELLSFKEENTLSDELDEIFSALSDSITVDIQQKEQQRKEYAESLKEKEKKKRRIM